jgi:Putative transposase
MNYARLDVSKLRVRPDIVVICDHRVDAPDRLEIVVAVLVAKVLRYCARPALSEERLSRAGDKVLLRLKTAWRDGTTHVVYEAIDFVAKLARSYRGPTKTSCCTTACYPPTQRGVRELSCMAATRLRNRRTKNPGPHVVSRLGMSVDAGRTLMKRAFGLDVLSCTQCGGRMRLIVVLPERTPIRKVLAHLDLPIASERASTRRPPDDDCFAFDMA